MPLANEMIALKAYLASWTGLNGVTIYIDELPSTATKALSDAVEKGTSIGAIVLQDTGGGLPNNSYNEFSVTTKQLKCYAESLLHARTIWNECRAALKVLHRNAKYANVWLYSVSMGAPLAMREAAPLNWPLCTSSFDLMASEVQ